MASKIWRTTKALAKSSWRTAAFVSAALAIYLLPDRWHASLEAYGGWLGRAPMLISREALKDALVIVLLAYVAWIDARPSMLRWWHGRKGRIRVAQVYAQCSDVGPPPRYHYASYGVPNMFNVQHIESMEDGTIRVEFADPVNHHNLSARMLNSTTAVPLLNCSRKTAEFRVPIALQRDQAVTIVFESTPT